MTALTALLAGAAIALALARWLNVPSVPFLLLTGLVLANTGLLDRVQLQAPLMLGVTFLLFLGGLELNPVRVGRQRAAALRVGLAQFFLLGAAGFLIGILLGFGRLTSLYLALALTASSTLVVVQLLQRRQQLFEPFGRMVLGVVLLQDLLVILLIPLVRRASEGAVAALLGLLATLAMTVLAFICLRWMAPLILRIAEDEETLLLVTLSVLFIFLGIADLLRVPFVAGAFLAGFALSSFPVSGIVRGQLGSITDFFSAAFFVALGGLILVPGIREFTHALVFAALVVVVTPPLVAFVTERAGFSARPAIESGLLLAQTSELSLVVVLQGMILGQVGENVFSIVVIVTAVTMLLTPFLSAERVTRLMLRVHPLRRDTQVTRELTDHVVLVGCGSAGMPLLETMLAAGTSVVVVDDDPAVIARLRHGDVPSIRGDALDGAALADAGVQHARIVSSTVRRARDNELLLTMTNDVRVLVRVFEDEEGQWVQARGGVPVMSSDAGASAFLRWYDKRIEKAAPPPKREP